MDDTQHAALKAALKAAMIGRCQWPPESAIRERCGIEPEIYRNLFETILGGKPFEYWQNQRSLLPSAVCWRTRIG